MNITEFAQRYKVRTRKDSCGDEIIPGRRTDKRSKLDRPEDHHHISEFNGVFVLYMNFPTKPRWTYAKKALLTAGFKIRQDGDVDGLLAFDPEDVLQVQLILKLAGVRIRRQLTPEQSERLKARFAKKGATA